MNFSLTSLLNKRASLLLAAVAACGGMARGQSAFELQELNTTLQVAAQKLQALESQLANAKLRNEALTQSAAAANEEAAALKERYERLRSLLEGLGIAALENSKEETQERLLGALSDLRLSEASRQKLADSLMELAESSLQFARTVQTPDPAAVERLQKALEKAESTLGAASGTVEQPNRPARDLQDARIVSLKAELGVAVLSVGSLDGVKPGMPFEIYREDKPIAKVLVTEVRKNVCGAVVQELANATDPVRVGDRAKVDTNRSF